MDNESKVRIYVTIMTLAASAALIFIVVGGILTLVYGINAIFT